MDLRLLANAALLIALAQAPARAQAAAQAPAPALPAITLPAELDRVLRDYERLWQAGDEAGLAAIFTEDGFVPSRGGWLRGREAIQRNYASAGGQLRLEALAFAVQDTVGYIVGRFRYGEGPANGKFVLALRRTATGPWLIAADLDN